MTPPRIWLYDCDSGGSPVVPDTANRPQAQTCTSKRLKQAVVPWFPGGPQWFRDHLWQWFPGMVPPFRGEPPVPPTHGTLRNGPGGSRGQNTPKTHAAADLVRACARDTAQEARQCCA